MTSEAANPGEERASPAASGWQPGGDGAAVGEPGPSGGDAGAASCRGGFLRVAMVQMNPTVGDIEGNTAAILRWLEEARRQGSELVVFPELAVTGYPPEDLVFKPSFLQDNLAALRRLAEATRGLTAIVGFLDWQTDVYNAAGVLHDGRWAATARKVYLPNYGVFDEDRYFQAGDRALLLRLGEAGIGVGICEDIWYPTGPARAQALAGATVIVNINASPYHVRKGRFREKMLATRASDDCAYVIYVNMVGGQDELVFDGQSLIVSPAGETLCRGPAFREELILWDLDLGLPRRVALHDPRLRKDRARAREVEPFPVEEVRLERLPAPPRAPLAPRREEAELEAAAEVYEALVTGTRDYVRKNGFRGVLLGLSGGIDSALVAAIAADAVGPENVTCLFLPSRYTARSSEEDARQVAKNLGVRLVTVPIDDLFAHYLRVLGPNFAGRAEDTTEENVQARIRGTILMAFSNKFGWLLLTTGNKSELSTGYVTLYGDMAGGFAVLKDVPKTMVYALARHRNARGPSPVIPERVLTKPPSAELKADQKDADTLPPYEVLDPILRAYVEEDRSLEEIVATGFDEETVRRSVLMVDRAEYKRRQAPPGIKITPRAFGRDRRMPITNRYRE